MIYPPINSNHPGTKSWYPSPCLMISLWVHWSWFKSRSLLLILFVFHIIFVFSIRVELTINLPSMKCYHCRCCNHSRFRIVESLVGGSFADFGLNYLLSLNWKPYSRTFVKAQRSFSSATCLYHGVFYPSTLLNWSLDLWAWHLTFSHILTLIFGFIPSWFMAFLFDLYAQVCSSVFCLQVNWLDFSDHLDQS